MLLDYGLPQKEAQTALAWIRKEWPRARCVALVDDEQQDQRARDAGIQVVLMKGILAARLLDTIEEFTM